MNKIDYSVQGISRPLKVPLLHYIAGNIDNCSDRLVLWYAFRHLAAAFLVQLPFYLTVLLYIWVENLQINQTLWRLAENLSYVLMLGACLIGFIPGLMYLAFFLKLLINGLLGRSADQPLEGIIRPFYLLGIVIMFVISLGGWLYLQFYLIDPLLDERRAARSRTAQQVEYLEILNQGPEAWNRWLRDFTGMQKYRLEFKGMNLTGRDLRGYNLSELEFINVSLKNADLRGVEMDRLNLSGADCRGADFSGAYMNYVKLTEADCRGALFRNSYMIAVDFQGSDLSGADFSGAWVKVERILESSHRENLDLLSVYEESASESLWRERRF